MKKLSNDVKLAKKIELVEKLAFQIDLAEGRLKAKKAKLKAYEKEITALRKLVNSDGKVVSIKKGRAKKAVVANS